MVQEYIEIRGARENNLKDVELRLPKRNIQTLSPRIRQKVEPFLKLGPCPLCKGARLNQAALSCRINGDTIADLSAMEVDELLEVVKDLKDPAAAPSIR